MAGVGCGGGGLVMDVCRNDRGAADGGEFPGGGGGGGASFCDDAGRVVAAATPEDVVRLGTHTGVALAGVLGP